MSKIKYLFNNFEFIIGAVLSIVMVAVLFIQVVSRYVFSYSLAFAEEFAVILFILSVYFGAIGATRRGQHLKIELLTNALSPKGQLVVGILADLAFIVANMFIIYGVMQVTGNLLNYGMTTAIMGIPKWICYSFLPFAFFVITLRLIQGIVIKIKSLSSETQEQEGF